MNLIRKDQVHESGFMILLFAPVFVVLSLVSLLPFVNREIVKNIGVNYFVIFLTVSCLSVLPVFSEDIPLQLLCMALLLGAAIDRYTAYAPDGVVIPILFLSIYEGALFSSEHIITQVVIACISYATAEALWALQSYFKKTFITSADILALVSPLFFFGLTSEYLLFNPLLVSVLFLVKKSAYIRKIVSHPDAVKNAIEDTQMNLDALGVTLLTVVYPIFYGFIIYSTS